VKSGGFTAYNTLNPLALEPFEPEVLWAYEVGFKSDLMDNTVRLNGAIFYYDYTDQQVQDAIYDSVLNATVGRIVNAPESRIIGAELELDWLLTDNLRTSHAIGYQNGEFEEFGILDAAASVLADAEVRNDVSGERLGPPELTYSGSLTYENIVMGDWGLRAMLDWSYRGDTDPPLLQPVSGEGYGVPSYWLLNASLAVQPGDGPVEIALWGRNILDEDYEETRNFFAGPDFTPLSAPGMPATYGVRVSIRH
jgi:outer membrane receptor protein involved in Fe transport